jgi:hypothetical protein
MKIASLGLYMVIPYFQTLFQLFGVRKNSTFVEIDALWNY